jgi:hypothetical protein
MDSEEPPNVRVACSGDIDEVVRLMHDAAAWMSAKGTPARSATVWSRMSSAVADSGTVQANTSHYRSATVWSRMSSAVADSGTVQANTSLAMAPKPRLFFLSTESSLTRRLSS